MKACMCECIQRYYKVTDDQATPAYVAIWQKQLLKHRRKTRRPEKIFIIRARSVLLVPFFPLLLLPTLFHLLHFVKHTTLLLFNYISSTFSLTILSI